MMYIPYCCLLLSWKIWNIYIYIYMCVCVCVCVCLNTLYKYIQFIDCTSYPWMLVLRWSNKTETCCHNKILIFIHCCCVLTINLKHFVLHCSIMLFTIDTCNFKIWDERNNYWAGNNVYICGLILFFIPQWYCLREND